MIRSAGTALVGTAVLAALTGCASQDSFGLPDLTPQGAQPSVQVYPGYGANYGYGYGYPVPYYAAQGPYPYAYGYGYNPYSRYVPYPRYVVVPCADNNRDGRCDSRPPKDRDHQGHDGRDRDHDRDHDRDDRPVPPRYARGVVPDVEPDTGPDKKRRVRRHDAPVPQPQSAPAPAPEVKQPARVRPDPRRDASRTQEL